MRAADSNPRLAERDENAVRKPLTRSEAVAVAREIERVEKEKAPKGGRGKTSGDSSEGSGEAKEIAAAAVGMSRPTLQKAEKVVQAAEEDQETFGPVVRGASLGRLRAAAVGTRAARPGPCQNFSA